MPAKFSRLTVSTAAYVQLDPNVTGKATVVFNNPAGIGMRFAGEQDAAPVVGTTVYSLVSTNSGGVYSITCNPSRTWVRADTGGGALEFHINW